MTATADLSSMMLSTRTSRLRGLCSCCQRAISLANALCVHWLHVMAAVCALLGLVQPCRTQAGQQSVLLHVSCNQKHLLSRNSDLHTLCKTGQTFVQLNTSAAVMCMLQSLQAKNCAHYRPKTVHSVYRIVSPVRAVCCENSTQAAAQLIPV